MARPPERRGRSPETRPGEHPSRPSIRLERCVEWADNDPSGHWHNTAAVRMVESAERVLFDRLGLVDLYGRMPRVHISVDFRLPLRFSQLAEIALEVVDVGTTSITYRAEISRRGEICAELRMVAVLRDDDGQPTSWSEEQRRLLTTTGPQRPVTAPP